jgi:hypothetical protein
MSTRQCFSPKIGENRRKLAKIAENWRKSPKIGENRRKLAKIAEDLRKTQKIVITTSTPVINREFATI